MISHLLEPTLVYCNLMRMLRGALLYTMDLVEIDSDCRSPFYYLIS